MKPITTSNIPFLITFPTLEHAVSALCEKVFGATLKLVPDETGSDERPTPLTNALADEIYASGIRVSEIRMLQHARDLERQLVKARKDNATSQDFITTLRCELDEARSQRDEWKAKYVQQNKDLGCELLDPNGTIWDEAKRLKKEKEKERLRDALIAIMRYDNEDVPLGVLRQCKEALEALKP